MHLTLCGKRNRKNFKNFGKWQKTPARNRITNVSYNCLIHLFYTTILVLFYVLIPQKVTAKGLPEKHAKNRAKMAQKRSLATDFADEHRLITA
jgi:hypothetical protein